MSEDLRRVAERLKNAKDDLDYTNDEVRALAADYLRSLDENAPLREALKDAEHMMHEAETWMGRVKGFQDDQSQTLEQYRTSILHLLRFYIGKANAALSPQETSE